MALPLVLVVVLVLEIGCGRGCGHGIWLSKASFKKGAHNESS